ncbi:MAG: putative Histidine kinase [Deltaproteobacteria bacterium]|nr:putative Histidine kinase [Deltaproteobacteria bacterium]
MRIRLNTNLRVRLFQLVFIALLPALGLIVYHAGEQSSKAVSDAENEALRMARVVAADQRRFIDSSGHLLIALSQLAEVRSLDVRACSALFARLLKEYRSYSNLGVATVDGNIVCSGRRLQIGTNVADHQYFQEAVQRKELGIGNYQVGLNSSNASLNFGYPVFNGGEQPIAVVFVAVDLVWLNQTAKFSGLPEGSKITLYDRNATILSRYPEAEGFIGRSFPNAEIVKIVMARGEGVAQATGIDGKQRLFGFASVGGATQKGQILLHVGIPKGLALADADWYLKRNLAALLAVGLLALLVAWYLGDVLLVRQIRSLAKTTARIGAGDFTARTGLSRRKNELDRFALSLDRMAELIERRDRDAEKAKQRAQRQLQRFDALREIDMAISSKLDLAAVLDVLFEKVELVLPGGVATVRLFNKRTGELEAVACRNLDEAFWRAENRQIVHGFEKTVLDNRIPLTIANVQTDPRAASHQFAARFGLVSCLVLPLIAAGDLLGLIDFYTAEEHAFDDEEIDFLAALAGLAAVASHNGRLFEEIRRRETEALALHALTAAASQSLDLNVVLNEAVIKIGETFRFDATRIFLFNHDMTELGIKAASENRPGAWLDSLRYLRGESIVGRVAETGEAMVFEDLTVDRRYRELSVGRAAEKAGNRFLALVPLKTKFKIWGAAVFAGAEPRKLTDEDIRLLTSMCRQIGIAVENADLYEQTAAKAKELTALYAFAGLASQSLDINILLRRTTEKIREIFQFDAARVFLRQGQSDDLELVTHMGFPDGFTPTARYRVGEGRVGRAAETGEPMFADDMELDQSYQRTARSKLLLKQGFHGSFLMPIKVGGVSFGVMNFLSKKPYHFSESDIHLIHAVAYHLGVAMGNANLYSQVREKSIDLEKANKAKDEFLGVISHELRTPLNVIKGYAEIMRQKVFGEVNAEQESALDKITTQSMTLLHMINDVLQVSTIEANSSRVARSDIDLVALLAELSESYRFACGKSLDIIWDIPSDLPTIRTDDEKLRAILQNLVNNSLKFTERGTVAVFARYVPDKDVIEFKVTDTGIGIPAGKIGTIFDMFQQVDNSVTRGYGGVGLGLYIVKNFSDLLGGAVAVVSEVGKGTTFTVTIPVTVDAEAGPNETRPNIGTNELAAMSSLTSLQSL